MPENNENFLIETIRRLADLWVYMFTLKGIKKTLKILGITLLIIIGVIGCITIIVLFVNNELPNWLSFLIAIILVYWGIKSIIKDAIKESIDNSEIIDKLDEISEKLSYRLDEDEDTQIGIGSLSYSSYRNLKEYLSSINENLKAIKEIVKNR